MPSMSFIPSPGDSGTSPFERVFGSLSGAANMFQRLKNNEVTNQLAKQQLVSNELQNQLTQQQIQTGEMAQEESLAMRPFRFKAADQALRSGEANIYGQMAQNEGQDIANSFSLKTQNVRAKTMDYQAKLLAGQAASAETGAEADRFTLSELKKTTQAGYDAYDEILADPNTDASTKSVMKLAGPLARREIATIIADTHQKNEQLAFEREKLKQIADIQGRELDLKGQDLRMNTLQRAAADPAYAAGLAKDPLWQNEPGIAAMAEFHKQNRDKELKANEIPGKLISSGDPSLIRAGLMMTMKGLKTIKTNQTVLEGDSIKTIQEERLPDDQEAMLQSAVDALSQQSQADKSVSYAQDEAIKVTLSAQSPEDRKNIAYVKTDDEIRAAYNSGKNIVIVKPGAQYASFLKFGSYKPPK